MWSPAHRLCGARSPHAVSVASLCLRKDAEAHPNRHRLSSAVISLLLTKRLPAPDVPVTFDLYAGSYRITTSTGGTPCDLYREAFRFIDPVPAVKVSCRFATVCQGSVASVGSAETICHACR